MFSTPRLFTLPREQNEVAVRITHDERALGNLLNTVMQLNHAILEAFDRLHVQRHMAVTPRHQWNAVPNEHRDHADDELVDRLLVKKGGDEVAAAHQPDILARLVSKTAHEWADCTIHELHA